MRAIAASIVVLSGAIVIAATAIAAALEHRFADDFDARLAIGIIIAAYGTHLIWSELRRPSDPSE